MKKLIFAFLIVSATFIASSFLFAEEEMAPQLSPALMRDLSALVENRKSIILLKVKKNKNKEEKSNLLRSEKVYVEMLVKLSEHPPEELKKYKEMSGDLIENAAEKLQRLEIDKAILQREMALSNPKTQKEKNQADENFALRMKHLTAGLLQVSGEMAVLAQLEVDFPKILQQSLRNEMLRVQKEADDAWEKTGKKEPLSDIKSKDKVHR